MMLPLTITTRTHLKTTPLHQKIIFPETGFNSEYNALHVFWRDRKNNQNQSPLINEQHFEIAKKSQLAKQLIKLIASAI